jgi:putative DNA primase/helicase
MADAQRGIAYLDAEIERRRKHTEEEVPEFSEDALALEFTRRHGEDLRYVAPWGKWLRYDGTRWAEDRTIRVFDLAREVVRDAATGADEKLARQITSAKTVAAIERLARSDPKHAILPEQLDADLYLFNTPGGTVDLRTGELRPHRREDLITKTAGATPDHDADDSTWIKFLADITCGQQDIADYLQRLFGYSLSADVRDHVLAFFYGTGANGKSTLIDLVLHVLGDYAKLIGTETLMEARGERHPTDIANLLGVRLAVSSEVEEGQHWAESRIKALTGDAVLTGRFMRMDFFEFRRTHKLVVAGNHRPSIRTVDEAIQRRSTWCRSWRSSRATRQTATCPRSSGPGGRRARLDGARVPRVAGIRTSATGRRAQRHPGLLRHPGHPWTLARRALRYRRRDR